MYAVTACSRVNASFGFAGCVVAAMMLRNGFIGPSAPIASGTPASSSDFIGCIDARVPGRHGRQDLTRHEMQRVLDDHHAHRLDARDQIRRHHVAVLDAGPLAAPDFGAAGLLDRGDVGVDGAIADGMDRERILAAVRPADKLPKSIWREIEPAPFPGASR